MSQSIRATAMVIACFGALQTLAVPVWVQPSIHQYASELFGPGHAPIKYGDAPISINILIAGDNDNLLRDGDQSSEKYGTARAGSADIVITLGGDATFAGNVTGLLWDPNYFDGIVHEDDDNNSDTPADNDQDNDPDTIDELDDETPPVTAPGTVASIVAGGRKGDNSITIRIEEAGDTSAANVPTTAAQAAAATTRNTAGWQKIRFLLPPIANLEVLGGASGSDKKTAYFFAESRLVSGAFPSGPLTGDDGSWLVQSQDSLSLEITNSNKTKQVGIDDDGEKKAFHFIKQTPSQVKTDGEGVIHLGAVRVQTRPVRDPAKPATAAEDVYRIRNADGTDGGIIYKPAQQATAATYVWWLRDLDGEFIQEGNGMAGVVRVDAEGTRNLFNDSDVLFVDYDKDGKMGEGEQLAIDGHRAVGVPLSIDAAESDSFDRNGLGIFEVYYVPGGEEPFNHASEIRLTASVDYSDPSAIDEKDAKATTTFNFDGVESEVLAYAIPFDGNGKGDQANIRVRCENTAGCRVFVECTDDDAMRGFGEAETLVYEQLTTWSSSRLEEIIGVENATSRHSCRILSKGKVRLQHLVRDGSSMTLVNNTYIGE